ncbi:hypothetical protein SOVF_000310 [Spinacia oleracea]|uniref:Uncharacterized protein n=1 Tax=Spinacia oleracea TaxID=3562 RepID=A0A9R0JH59_SPIOL|nr:uncharacterized protein LOC110805087 [Spinacia oleracea]KNA26115.1 hypothetical protein SOVF_000310 [Spinacia oleracea]
MAEDCSVDVDDVGFEEGLTWLPAHILHEACGGQIFEEQVGHRARHYQHQNHVNGPGSYPLHPLKSGRKYQERVRIGSKRTSGGPGMQAVFLDQAGHNKTCGTGVFLPRRAGTDFQPTKNPPCSPVLLPSRVVHGLNLNIQALGLQISPKQDLKTTRKDRVHNANYKKEEKDPRERCDIISQDQKISPELFLPKEWSY